MATLPSAHWSNVLDVPTRIAGSRARPNESPQVVACQSVRVLYLIIFPRPAVPASARRRFSLVFSRLLGLSPFLVRSPSLSVSFCLILSLFLCLSLYLSVSRFRSIPLCRCCLCLAHDRSLTPVCGGSHGGLFTEREPRKQKNHAAEQHVCCARTDRTSHPRTLHISACTFRDPGSKLDVDRERSIPRDKSKRRESTVSIIDIYIYISRFDIARLGSNRFDLWRKVHMGNAIYLEFFEYDR